MSLQLNTAERFVLVTMMMHADRGGWVLVSRERLARMTGLHPGSVKRVIGRLRDAGVISYPERVRGGGYRWKLTWRDMPTMLDALKEMADADSR